MCDLRRCGNSEDACLDSAAGGDIATGGGGAVVGAIEVTEVRGYKDGGFVSRAGRSELESSIDEIDMLLPGRCNENAPRGSRWAKEELGAGGRGCWECGG